MRCFLTLLLCLLTIDCLSQSAFPLEKLNRLRTENKLQEFTKDSLLDKLLKSNDRLLLSNNADSIREILRENFIYDYKISTVRIKKNQFLNLSVENIQTIDKGLEALVNDSNYNTVGIVEYPDQFGLIFLQSFMTIDLLEQPFPAMGGLNNNIVIPPAENYVIIIGATKLDQLYYTTLKDEKSLIPKEIKKLRKEPVFIENSRFRIKLMEGDGHIIFFNEKDEMIYIFRSL